nr:MAG TPA: calcium binding protein [Caudoviricetes sp.]
MLPFMMEKILDEKILAQKCVRVYKKGSLTEEDYLTAVKSYLQSQYDTDWVENLTSSDFVINKVTD